MAADSKVILIAEDEHLVRMDAAEALTEAGFHVIEAQHADDAVAILAEQASEIHALFTDVHMPGTMDGLALAHLAQKSWPWIAVLIASGKARPRETDLPTGSRFISKPYDTAYVIRHLHELIRRH